MEHLLPILLTANLGFLAWVAKELVSIRMMVADFGHRIGLLEARKPTQRKNTPCLG